MQSLTPYMRVDTYTGDPKAKLLDMSPNVIEWINASHTTRSAIYFGWPPRHHDTQTRMENWIAKADSDQVLSGQF